ncbi:MAG: lipase family protein [Lentimicrobiaceae bacterium]|nr:lipase family protein [Lentimicrobiaceae bacterium]
MYKSNSVILLFLLFSIFLTNEAHSQLEPGFDSEEYRELLRMAVCVADTPWIAQDFIPHNFELAYRSQVTGLENRWDLWIHREQPVAAISIRGTTSSSLSWLGNFYAAMTAANGSFQLTTDKEFSYRLATNPRAAVHVGWLMSLGFMADGILNKVDSCYKAGYHNFYITGHSQGGGISFLLTAYLRMLQINGALPNDITFKTYCSAAPKPGNLYFAYDYEAMTAGGWAFNVVNTADWVPETPLSIQTVDDFNKTNPFINAQATINKQPFAKRMVMKYAYNRLNRPARKTVKNYQKFLGGTAGKMAQKSLPGYQPPEYLYENSYVRTGSTIVLYADESYYKRYPDTKDDVFIHHQARPYLFLLDKLSR